MSDSVLTLLAITDLHGHLLEWDYLNDQPPTEPGSLARISTLVRQIRSEGNPVLLMDVGDTIQGTAMMTIAAHERHRPHPAAQALNYLGVDAACVGNHELNFGLDYLADYAGDCHFPLLAANLRGAPGVRDGVILSVDLGGVGAVRVGIIGLTTPGSLIWDRDHLAGRVSMDGVAEAAAQQVANVRRDGAEVVVVLSHSGLGPSSTYGDALDWPENDTIRLIRTTPGIDAVFLGHKHAEEVGYQTCAATGVAVPYVEPWCYGRRLARIDLHLGRQDDGSLLVRPGAPRSMPVAAAAVDPALSELLAPLHRRTLAHVNRAVGVATERIDATPVTQGPSAAVDLINMVQAQAVSTAVDAVGRSVRVLSLAALSGGEQSLAVGPIAVRDLLRLYRFENTLQAIELTTSQLLAYLEHNALGFGRSHVPTYNVDSLGAADHAVSYVVDPSAPSGQRVSDLRIDGAAPDPAERFLVAISSYRAAGSGGFPGTADNPPAYDGGQQIQDLLVDWVRRQGTISLMDITRASWRVRERTDDEEATV